MTVTAIANFRSDISGNIGSNSGIFVTDTGCRLCYHSLTVTLLCYHLLSHRYNLLQETEQVAPAARHRMKRSSIELIKKRLEYYRIYRIKYRIYRMYRNLSPKEESPFQNNRKKTQHASPYSCSRMHVELTHGSSIPEGAVVLLDSGALGKGEDFGKNGKMEPEVPPFGTKVPHLDQKVPLSGKMGNIFPLHTDGEHHPNDGEHDPNGGKLLIQHPIRR